ncbi:acyl-CoA thioesterase [Gynuella sunshinyii]|uniref:acyl-CoA thioesterase n=1 Tax=Gynuella sunshinyii TaxID=1445505 RepID=UPI0011852288|nr:thioesterase family protein [Gynuella sunshinyii]
MRIPFHDVDMHGHVHNSVYFPYCETAITEYLRQQGLSEVFSPTAHDYAYHVHKVEFTFHRPSFFEQQLYFHVQPAKLSRTTIEFRVSVYATEEPTPRVQARIVWVCVQNRQIRVQAIAPAVREALIPLLES